MDEIDRVLYGAYQDIQVIAENQAVEELILLPEKEKKYRRNRKGRERNFARISLFNGSLGSSFFLLTVRE